MSSATHLMPTRDELRLVSQSFTPNQMQTEISVPDMHCGSCMGRIEKALVALEGIETVRVNLTNKRVSINWSADINPEIMFEELARLGFHPVLPSTQSETADKKYTDYLKALAVSGFAAGNVMLLSVAVWSGADASTRQLFHWISALITIPAVLYAGRFFYRSAWFALRSGNSNMDVPITVGILLACCMSLYDTVVHAQHVYFEAVSMLVFFLLIGRTVDYMMREKAMNSINGLQRLEPVGAHLVDSDGALEYVPTRSLLPGDRIVVSAGTRIPVDGVVVSGISDVNSEIVDGESLPRTVSPNHPVLAGSLNLSTDITVKVKASAADSFLASIKQLVSYGEGARGPYRALADKASSLYSPVVHSAAFIAFLLWYFLSGDVHRSANVAISVLIITCPCALALAVPMVQAVAAQRLLSIGIIMKNGAALEKIRKIDTVVFDKTGTLTDGLPVVSSTSLFNSRTLALAQLLAKKSNHPYANAIQCISDSNKSVMAIDTVVSGSKIVEVPGCGLRATIGKKVVRLGNRPWACSKVMTNSSEGREHDDKISECVLTEDGQITAVFEFDHRLRVGAQTAIKCLREQVPNMVILSGDKPAPVKTIASRLNIASFHSQCLPDEKQRRVIDYARRGVIMVGDGLNDAGAMAAATVSIAPANAASVSRTVADFVFLRSSLMAVPETITVARRAHTIVRQNFAIAIIYNLIALPFAFAGFVTPLVAAIAMSTSSVLVVANALRISRSGANGESFCAVKHHLSAET